MKIPEIHTANRI